MDPKVKFEGARLVVTGPPLGMWPLVPAALMVTEDLRLWSPWAGVPLTMVGAMVGTAGWMGFLPFTGEMDELLPWWAFCGPPTATGGAALDAIGGDEIFLVAEAYELRAVG
jgi:hypothetical protein